LNIENRESWYVEYLLDLEKDLKRLKYLASWR
jgi:hypothetical protein